MGFASADDSRSLELSCCLQRQLCFVFLPFEADCFDSASTVKLSVGYELQHKDVLLDTVVPTILARTSRPTLKKETYHK